MARGRKTERVDDLDYSDEPSDRAAEREDPREVFENEMFTDAVASPLHIDPQDWPEGKAFRWISIEVTGAPDNRNWSVKTAAHWTPVQRGKYPHIDKKLPIVAMPGTADNGAGAAIIFGGLCLCERDIRLNLRDRKAQQKATQDQQRTIDTYVEGGNANFPRVNMSSDVQYERAKARFKE